MMKASFTLVACIILYNTLSLCACSYSIQNLRDKEEKMNGKEWKSDLFEGDIVISKEQLAHDYGEDAANKAEAAGLLEKSKEIINKNKQKQKASDKINNNSNDADGRGLGIISDYKYIWATRDVNNKVIVPYELDPAITNVERKIIFEAMDYIAIQTGVINFVSRTNEPDWIYFQNFEMACWSFIGKRGGMQEINIFEYCGFGATVHEICHSLGFYHEQSRADRDNYVTINWSNIQLGLSSNFLKKNTTSLGSFYDYGSIMHYSAAAFGKVDRKWKTFDLSQNQTVQISYTTFLSQIKTKYCFTLIDGDKGVKDDQFVYLRPCKDIVDANQLWIIDAVGRKDNLIRFAYDPTFCLVPEYQPKWSSNIRPSLIMRKCSDAINVKDKLFQLEWYAWNLIYLVWSRDSRFLTTMNIESSEPETFSLYLTSYGRSSRTYQVFGAEFITNAVGRAAKINIYENQPRITIDAKGNKIGQRDGLSEQDILQLQLLYQCPSGPRQINTFCSTDCKCRFNQGNCTNNNQCQNGLICTSDGTSVSMKRCLRSSPTPSKEPTRLPTESPVISPSTAPILPCSSFNNKIKCITSNNRQCRWKNGRCQPR